MILNPNLQNYNHIIGYFLRLVDTQIKKESFTIIIDTTSFLTGYLQATKTLIMILLPF